ncbi:hypothetical protein [Hymenobacter convexus]|uniref:hypothetical protein n=1 Tax=Hymenobacter sp. CA1UV-4 TaxID=3063782 RepID=UPI0027143D62|nr:hypothetical protein [Hymenobacter sp. CA1UV-4]MDO7850770.1 hypothetical protein [Hymenobacter sp. CA1UV-4]
MLLSKQYTTRWPARLGLLTMLVLLAMAWHFYQERTAYYDLAYHLFRYFQNNELFIQNRRFAAAITQYPTLLSIRAGWSLEAVMRTYSLVFILFYLSVYLISAYWFKNEYAALLVPLLFVLIASRTFYWAQSELPQGLALLLLFYAGISKQAPVRASLGTLALLALVPAFIFCHPLVVVPFVFLWAYDWLLNRRLRDWLYYGVLAFGLAVYEYRSATIPPDNYEAHQMTFGANLAQYYPNYMSLESWPNFWHLCANNFIALPVLLAVCTVYFLWKKSWWGVARLLLVWVFVMGYTFVVIVSRPGYTEATYRENQFLPLGIFIAVPLVMELLPALERAFGRRGPWVAASVLALVLVGRLLVVWRTHEPYTAYNQWLKHVMHYAKAFPEHRLLVHEPNVDPYRQRAGWSYWASPCESLFLSSVPSPDSAQTVFITTDLPTRIRDGQQPGRFLGPFENIPSFDLPGAYFRLPLDKPYRLLNTDPPVADTTALAGYVAAHQGVRLSLNSPLPRLRHGHAETADVRIEVPAAMQPLHSGTQGPHTTFLYARFRYTGDWPVAGNESEEVDVPLEVDVYHPWSQTLPINCPSAPGRYELELGLRSKAGRVWPVRLRVPVEVK